MCGICGFYTRNNSNPVPASAIERATQALNLRGPDNQNVTPFKQGAFGHARLSIIDTSNAANQPFESANGRFLMVFNGEIYNYKTLRKTLEQQGVQFKTQSDTEVLIELYAREGLAALQKLNGFFAFAVYDKETDELFVCRDRMGIKPLLFHWNEEAFYFASEMKALVEFPIERKLNQTALYSYLQLNYTPAPLTMLENVFKLRPGYYLHLKEGKLIEEQYYKVPYNQEQYTNLSYEQAQKQLIEKLHQSVEARMVADVPLGSFLSGGIDSSVIATIASSYTDKLNTFSIGYSDEPYFDETKYAALVAKKLKTEHTVFSLSNQDLFEHLTDVLDYMDEPFADSSALAVHLLSKRTKEQVTVALSGDGADEIFSGYNKHAAEYRARSGGLANAAVKAGAPLWKRLPQSRNSKFGNLARQLDRFAHGVKLSAADRYWEWAVIRKQKEAEAYLVDAPNLQDFAAHRAEWLSPMQAGTDFNNVLYTDTHLVLANDMLTKVDLMSMSRSLEVRTPFLDHGVVEFAFQLPPDYKIDGQFRKKILQDAFRDQLPAELYDRPKHGFEVPLLKWFQRELRDLIDQDLLGDRFIQEQGIFRLETIQKLKAQLFSNSPGDATATVWAVLVFQHWWKRYLSA